MPRLDLLTKPLYCDRVFESPEHSYLFTVDLRVFGRLVVGDGRVWYTLNVGPTLMPRGAMGWLTDTILYFTVCLSVHGVGTTLFSTIFFEVEPNAAEGTNERSNTATGSTTTGVTTLAGNIAGGIAGGFAGLTGMVGGGGTAAAAAATVSAGTLCLRFRGKLKPTVSCPLLLTVLAAQNRWAPCLVPTWQTLEGSKEARLQDARFRAVLELVQTSTPSRELPLAGVTSQGLRLKFDEAFPPPFCVYYPQNSIACYRPHPFVSICTGTHTCAAYAPKGSVEFSALKENQQLGYVLGKHSEARKGSKDTTPNRVLGRSASISDAAATPAGVPGTNALPATKLWCFDCLYVARTPAPLKSLTFASDLFTYLVTDEKDTLRLGSVVLNKTSIGSYRRPAFYAHVAFVLSDPIATDCSQILPVTTTGHFPTKHDVVGIEYMLRTDAAADPELSPRKRAASIDMQRSSARSGTRTPARGTLTPARGTSPLNQTAQDKTPDGRNQDGTETRGRDMASDRDGSVVEAGRLLPVPGPGVVVAAGAVGSLSPAQRQVRMAPKRSHLFPRHRASPRKLVIRGESDQSADEDDEEDSDLVGAGWNVVSGLIAKRLSFDNTSLSSSVTLRLEDDDDDPEDVSWDRERRKDGSSEEREGPSSIPNGGRDGVFEDSRTAQKAVQPEGGRAPISGPSVGSESAYSEGSEVFVPSSPRVSANLLARGRRRESIEALERTQRAERTQLECAGRLRELHEATDTTTTDAADPTIGGVSLIAKTRDGVQHILVSLQLHPYAPISLICPRALPPVSDKTAKLYTLRYAVSVFALHAGAGAKLGARSPVADGEQNGERAAVTPQVPPLATPSPGLPGSWASGPQSWSGGILMAADATADCLVSAVDKGNFIGLRSRRFLASAVLDFCTSPTSPFYHEPRRSALFNQLSKATLFDLVTHLLTVAIDAVKTAANGSPGRATPGRVAPGRATPERGIAGRATGLVEEAATGSAALSRPASGGPPSGGLLSVGLPSGGLASGTPVSMRSGFVSAPKPGVIGSGVETSQSGGGLSMLGEVMTVEEVQRALLRCGRDPSVRALSGLLRYLHARYPVDSLKEFARLSRVHEPLVAAFVLFPLAQVSLPGAFYTILQSHDLRAACSMLLPLQQLVGPGDVRAVYACELLHTALLNADAIVVQDVYAFIVMHALPPERKLSPTSAFSSSIDTNDDCVIYALRNTILKTIEALLHEKKFRALVLACTTLSLKLDEWFGELPPSFRAHMAESNLDRVEDLVQALQSQFCKSTVNSVSDGSFSDVVDRRVDLFEHNGGSDNECQNEYFLSDWGLQLIACAAVTAGFTNLVDAVLVACRYIEFADLQPRQDLHLTT
ncbi:hypothetical protein GNI_001680 [Gregarina niphandrodes]|uniref:Uncharacterized protein n=1 Tax=Gregarina niphandrodes TaxID=110365 RepID=A0A023BDU5_GRENI|nr:hypothetical protein GNI_001680 [Gregarina niphandrodes]EZG89628.1 hypothetical protein GNI_001680 [Gregarina niphandrodes]|eukprot:XP_011128479.1 hypothetical protein GNI_001680 [Gregarina niphandrodes]